MNLFKRLKTAVKVGAQAFKLSKSVSGLTLDDYFERQTYYSIGRSVVAHTYNGEMEDLWICDRYLSWREASCVKSKWVARFGEIDSYELVKKTPH